MGCPSLGTTLSRLAGHDTGERDVSVEGTAMGRPSLGTTLSCLAGHDTRPRWSAFAASGE